MDPPPKPGHFHPLPCTKPTQTPHHACTHPPHNTAPKGLAVLSSQRDGMRMKGCRAPGWSNVFSSQKHSELINRSSWHRHGASRKRGGCTRQGLMQLFRPECCFPSPPRLRSPERASPRLGAERRSMRMLQQQHVFGLWVWEQAGSPACKQPMQNAKHSWCEMQSPPVQNASIPGAKCKAHRCKIQASLVQDATATSAKSKRPWCKKQSVPGARCNCYQCKKQASLVQKASVPGAKSKRPWCKKQASVPGAKSKQASLVQNATATSAKSKHPWCKMQSPQV